MALSKIAKKNLEFAGVMVLVVAVLVTSVGSCVHRMEEETAFAAAHPDTITIGTHQDGSFTFLSPPHVIKSDVDGIYVYPHSEADEYILFVPRNNFQIMIRKRGRAPLAPSPAPPHS